MTETERRVVPATVLGLVVLGALTGVAAKAADESSWRWAADLGSYPAAWVLGVALIGRAAPTWRAAAMRAAVFFVAMSLAYYAWAAWVLGFGWSRAMPAWLLLSVTVVPVFCVCTWWATQRAGVVPGALLALSAGITIAEGARGGVQRVVDVLVVAVVVLLLARHRATRLWALVLTLPGVWVAGWLFDLLRQVLHVG